MGAGRAQAYGPPTRWRRAQGFVPSVESGACGPNCARPAPIASPLGLGGGVRGRHGGWGIAVGAGPWAGRLLLVVAAAGRWACSLVGILWLVCGVAWPVLGSEWEAVSESESVSESEAVSDSEAESGSEWEAESESGSGSGSELESGSDSGSDSGSGSDSESELELESESESESDFGFLGRKCERAPGWGARCFGLLVGRARL